MYPDLPIPEVELHELPWSGGEHRLQRLELEAVPMLHREESLGYRLGAIGCSGDTAWGSPVAELARGLDLLLLECTYVTPAAGKAHLALEELREHRDELACRELVLVHVHDAVARALAAEPLRGTRVAADGDVVQVGGAP
jgi:ribonuclease BN (tRNA processing enzyme)